MKKVLLLILVTLFGKLNGQNTDFTFSDNTVGCVSSYTIIIRDAFNNVLFSGTPTAGVNCVTGGTPATIEIVGCTPQCSTNPQSVNSVFSFPSGCSCGPPCFDSSTPVFTSTFVSVGGVVCGLGGLLTLSIDP